MSDWNYSGEAVSEWFPRLVRIQATSTSLALLNKFDSGILIEDKVKKVTNIIKIASPDQSS